MTGYEDAIRRAQRCDQYARDFRNQDSRRFYERKAEAWRRLARLRQRVENAA